MKRNLFLTVLLIGIALIFSVCGDKADKPESPKTEKKAPVEKKAAVDQVKADDEGVVIGKEILETFDKAVAEAVALAKDKPAPAELKPKLEALIKMYEEKMKEINPRYLALKTKDIALFGSANGYIGENRGKRVWEKDKALAEYISHYNSQEGGKEIIQLISKDIVKMLDIAVQR